MKALLCDRYGPPDVLALSDVPRPTPKEDEVLIRVKAVALNSADWRIMNGALRFVGFGLMRPRHRILGADVAGEVVSVGRAVTDLNVGDEVYGDLSEAGFGGLAEYVAAPARLMARKPETLTFEQAAAIPLAGATALQGAQRCGEIRGGQRVAVYGASGGVGTYAVQIARAMGAHVTAAVRAHHRIAAQALGADAVVDSRDFATGQPGERFDVILAANSDRRLAVFRRALTPTGTVVVMGGGMRHIIEALALGPLLSRPTGHKIRSLYATTTRVDLDALRALIDAGRVAPVIARTFTLDQAVDAFRCFGAGRLFGKVVVSVAEGL